MPSHQYYIIYKPFGMLSQFSPEGDKPTLAMLGNFPKDVYPVGRLDSDSEGLLILTNDKTLNNRLLNPKFAHWRTYWAQVDGDVSEEALLKLRQGVTITVDGKPYATHQAKARKLETEPILPERNPPIRFRKNIPTSWIELTLHEGKNRQVRKMTASVGFPTLRLVRVSIENLKLNAMQPSEVKEITLNEIETLIFSKKP
jgi:23S rRNA pseudouridine2457 synthase